MRIADIVYLSLIFMVWLNYDLAFTPCKWYFISVRKIMSSLRVDFNRYRT